MGKPLKVVEQYYIEQALKLAAGNREEAAKMLNIGERTLYRKIKEYNIPNVKVEGKPKSGKPESAGVE